MSDINRAMTRVVNFDDDTQVVHVPAAHGVDVYVTSRGVIVQHANISPEYSVNVRTDGLIASQNGGRSRCSMVLTKGLKR